MNIDAEIVKQNARQIVYRVRDMNTQNLNQIVNTIITDLPVLYCGTISISRNDSSVTNEQLLDRLRMVPFVFNPDAEGASFSVRLRNIEPDVISNFSTAHLRKSKKGIEPAVDDTVLAWLPGPLPEERTRFYERLPERVRSEMKRKSEVTGIDLSVTMAIGTARISPRYKVALAYVRRSYTARIFDNPLRKKPEDVEKDLNDLFTYFPEGVFDRQTLRLLNPDLITTNYVIPAKLSAYYEIEINRNINFLIVETFGAYPVEQILDLALKRTNFINIESRLQSLRRLALESEEEEGIE